MTPLHRNDCIVPENECCLLLYFFFGFRARNARFDFVACHLPASNPKTDLWSNTRCAASWSLWIYAFSLHFRFCSVLDKAQSRLWIIQNDCYYRVWYTATWFSRTHIHLRFFSTRCYFCLCTVYFITKTKYVLRRSSHIEHLTSTLGRVDLRLVLRAHNRDYNL